jgi:type I restriction enzyme S subunit
MNKERLPRGWEEMNLLEHITLVPTGVKRFTGVKKYVDTGSLEIGKITDYVDVDYDSKPSRANIEVEKDDVLFAKMKGTEKIFLVSEESKDNLYSTGFSVLRVKDRNRVLPGYVVYWLRSDIFQNKKNKEATGATQKALNETKLKKFKIVLPPIDTQRKIVSVLERAESLHDRRQQVNEAADQFLKSVFINMFGDPIKNEMKFECKKLRNAVNIIVPTRDKPKSFTGTIPWITLPDLTKSLYIENSKYKLSVNEAKPTKARLFPGRTVLLSCAGSIGKVAVAKREVYTNQQFYGLVCKSDSIVPEFLAYQLLAFGEQFYRNLGGKFTLAFFKKDAALNIPIVLPPLAIQEKFASIVETVESLKAQQVQLTRETDDLFNSLMQKAFTGELVS